MQKRIHFSSVFSLDQLASVVVGQAADDDEDNVDDVPDTESTSYSERKRESKILGGGSIWREAGHECSCPMRYFFVLSGA